MNELHYYGVNKLRITKANGDFVEIAPIRVSRGKPIICEPIPGRDGVEYVQDWLGLTRFG